MLFRMMNAIKKRGILGFAGAGATDLLGLLAKFLAKARDNYSRYCFINRRSDSEILILVLAGYKPYLWPATLTRIKRYSPKGADICIVSSGLFCEKLSDFCQENGWSYLSVARNSPGVSLNRAIALHPKADFIYKLNEDIFIGDKFFLLLKKGYCEAFTSKSLEPGFCAPIINVNGISYSEFLRRLNIQNDYEHRFGKIIPRCGDVPIHNDPEACWWIWEKTLPFDTTARKFSEVKSDNITCCTRFSIGAILFRRSFILQAGGFKSSWHSGILGIDEEMLCRDCVGLSRPMQIVSTVLAGHFSFFHQEQFMREKLPLMCELDPETFPPDFF